jgi:hypothetical protein
MGKHLAGGLWAKMIQAIVVLIMVLSLFCFDQHILKATLGPVSVELNIKDDRQSAIRANKITSFKVNFRINKDIKVKDWVKIWFPVDEASNDKKNICDGLPKITGDNEHPRFVPNEKYFEKFPNSNEKLFGKIYEVFDKEIGFTRFDGCQCKYETEKKNNLKIVDDPSGLGCWIMGTVLPKLYRNLAKRYHQLVEICNYSALVYTPDSGVGLPLLKNTCNERSILITSPLDIEVWRKGYNPVEFNTSEKSGVLAPATPGRYKMVVATQPEPTPVESELFVLPCSQISIPFVTIFKAQKGNRKEMSISFTTGDGGALDKDVSTISIKFPKGVALERIKPEEITANNVKIKRIIEFSQTEGILTFEIQIDVSNGEKVCMSINSQTNPFDNLKAGKYQIEVWTSSEPDPVKSSDFEVVAK